MIFRHKLPHTMPENHSELPNHRSAIPTNFACVQYNVCLHKSDAPAYDTRAHRFCILCEIYFHTNAIERESLVTLIT